MVLQYETKPDVLALQSPRAQFKDADINIRINLALGSPPLMQIASVADCPDPS
jgi:hypothetical protein